MIIQLNHGYESISSQDELDEYYGLQENVGLRYAKANSLNCCESVRIFIPHKTEQYTLLVPYEKSPIPQPFSFKRIVNKGQSVRAITQYGMLKETGLRAEKIVTLGDPLHLEIIEEGEPRKIFIVAVPEYYKRMVYEPLYYNNPKYGPPVWVHTNLSNVLFETVKNEEDRFQLETNRRAKKWFAEAIK